MPRELNNNRRTRLPPISDRRPADWAFLRLGAILAEIARSSRQSEPKESPLGVARSSRKHSKNRSCKGQLENERTTVVHMFAVEAGVQQTVQKGVGGLP